MHCALSAVLLYKAEPAGACQQVQAAYCSRAVPERGLLCPCLRANLYVASCCEGFWKQADVHVSESGMRLLLHSEGWPKGEATALLSVCLSCLASQSHYYVEAVLCIQNKLQCVAMQHVSPLFVMILSVWPIVHAYSVVLLSGY